MKKALLTVTAILLALSMLGGCGTAQTESPTVTEPSAAPTEPVTTPATTTPTQPATTPAATTPTATESDSQQDNSAFDDTPYAQQIARYYTALSDQWAENAYFEQEMSSMVASYYEGNALDNVGFAFLDLDGDDTQELIIGAIMNAENDPLVFEIWTCKDGEPVMLVQSGSRNRYYLQYSEEDALWSVAYEAENGAANHATYYLYLADGKFEVIQGILFDAVANENAPWFMAYDLDWDSSNDMPTDEDTAIAVMTAERNKYTHLEYFPYSLYK